MNGAKIQPLFSSTLFWRRQRICRIDENWEYSYAFYTGTELRGLNSQLEHLVTVEATGKFIVATLCMVVMIT